MSANPPDFWEVLDTANIEWGTDIDVASSPNLTGGNSLWFKGTTPSVDAELISDFMLVQEQWDYQMRAAVYYGAGSPTGGPDDIFAIAKWYDADQSHLSDTTIFTEVNDVAEEWETQGGIVSAPADARFVRLVIGQQNTSSFDVYFDNIRFTKRPPEARLYRASSTTTIGNSYAEITLNAKEYASGMKIASGDAYVESIPVEGRYYFHGQIEVASVPAGDYIQVKVGGVEGPRMYNASGSSQTLVASASGVYEFGRGSVVKIEGRRGSGGSLNVSHGIEKTFLAVHMIE